MSARRSRSGRRELILAVVGCGIAGALVLLAAGRRWVSYAVGEGGHASAGPTGHDVAAGASALALVMLAAVVALPATRRWPRRAVGAVVAAAGAGTVALASHVLADPASAAGTRFIGVFSYSPNPTVGASATAWPWVDLLAGALAVIAGGAALARSGGWPAMGRRYESGDRARRPASEATMWDRLDRGDDPTL